MVGKRVPFEERSDVALQEVDDDMSDIDDSLVLTPIVDSTSRLYSLHWATWEKYVL